MSLESAPNRHPDRSQTSSLDQLSVRLIREDELGAWKQLMREHHYLGFRAVVGESLFYVAEIEGRWAALLGWGAAALSGQQRAVSGAARLSCAQPGLQGALTQRKADLRRL